jgi:hypothetical protein
MVLGLPLGVADRQLIITIVIERDVDKGPVLRCER